LRIPASLCGVVGFRTTPGLIPRYPNPWGWDPFSVTGPMARTVADTALMLSVVAGRDDRIPISQAIDPARFAAPLDIDIKGLRIAWSPDLGIATVDPEVVDVCRRALEQFQAMGCTVDEICPDFSTVRDIIAPLRAYRSAAVFADMLEQSMDGVANDFFKEFLDLAGKTSVAEAGRAEQRRYRLWLQAERFFHDYDLLICPATQMTAFPIEQLFPDNIAGQPMAEHLDSVLLTYAITLLGVPAISIPAGWNAAGLPVGLQIVGNRLDELTVLRASAAFEQAAPWAQRRPPIAV
jgi:amidase